ncbi:MAG: hypothetical protein Q8L14_38955 [Myxococcales bacterium]|nr:hypothetical protein [Myxococcales bacterium]
MVAVLLMVLAAESSSLDAHADEVASQRSRPRLHASVGGGASGALGGAAGGGLAFKGELGLLLGDRLSLLVRVGAGTTVVFGALFQGGLGVAASWGDHVLLGVGAELATLGAPALATHQGFSVAALFPFRFSWSPGKRSEEEVKRKGLQLSAEFSPGFTLGPSGGGPFVPFNPTRTLALGASVWVSHAWW